MSGAGQGGEQRGAAEGMANAPGLPRSLWTCPCDSGEWFRRASDESSCLGSLLTKVMGRPGVLRPLLSFQVIPSADEDVQRNPFRQALLLWSSGIPS